MTEPPDYWNYEDQIPDEDDEFVGDGEWRSWLQDAADDVIDFLYEAGITEPTEITVDLSDISDPAFIRTSNFPTIGQALNYLYDAGVLAFGRVLRRINEDGSESFDPVIPDTP